MENSTLQSIRELLDKNEQIGIVVGKDPSVDIMAAALSLYLFLHGQNKKVSIASPTEPIVEVSSLVGIDKVKTSLDGDGGDLIVSFPYKDDEIQKVSYTLENNSLNIIVKAGEAGLSFDEKQVQFRRGGGIPTLLFIVGTPRLSDLGQLFDAEALKGTTVANIDNKVNNQGFGDVVVVSAKFSSVSEQMAQILVFLEASIDVDIAQNLLSGIAYATDNFQNPKTSYIAFEMVGYLMKKGAVRPKIEPLNTNSEESFFPSFKNNNVPSGQAQQGNFPRQNRPQQAVGQAQQNKFPQRPQNQFQHQPNQPAPQTGQKTPSQQQPAGQFTGYPQAAKQTRGGKEDEQEAPPDWLTPKVYKSSNLG